MIRYRYTNIHPQFPAPLVHVSLRPPTGGGIELQDLPAQIDTAADRTVIPAKTIRQLPLIPLDRLTIGGLGGTFVDLPSYLVTLEVRMLRPLTLEVVAIEDEPWVLLGRDVLNQFRVLLDGPQQDLGIH